MEIIDLRSDTVTHPTPEMRLAMADERTLPSMNWRLYLAV